MESPDSQSINFGKNVQWLSNDLFLADSHLNNWIFYNPWVFSDGAYFDGSNTNFGELTLNNRQLTEFQVLETKRKWINSTQDILSIVPVASQTIIGEHAPELVLSGAVDNLFLADLNNPDYAIKIFNNTSLSHGWAVITAQESQLDPGSIGQAWIYDSVTRAKLADLEVVDVYAGVLPGSIAAEIDYISDVDPACYNIPAWGPGVVYAIGDRVIYNSQVWQAIYAGKSGSIFNASLWAAISFNSGTQLSGITLWGVPQVVKSWFCTANLKAIHAQLGTLQQRAQSWNQWFPSGDIVVYEWVNSTTPPAQYVSSDAVGHVLDPGIPFTYNAATGQYGFWVANKTVPGALHNQSVSQLSQDLANIPNTGIPMITVIDSNAVAVWNINQYVSSNTVILHIDYVLESANNQLHNEFALISNDGTKSWYKTAFYQKLVDSLSGVSSTGQLVPDFTLPLNQQVGILNNPVQSLFADRVPALDIYYTVVNQNLANIAIASSSVVKALTNADPLPIQGFNEQIPNREVLSGIDVDLYPENYKILLEVDSTLNPLCWSIVAAIAGQWQIAQHQLYNLSNYWKYINWQNSSYTNQVPTYTLNNLGELSLITPALGDIVEILNTGSGSSAVYQAEANSLNPAIVELNPIFIENGTIQFLPQLFDFITAQIGFGAAPFNSRYFNENPYLEIQQITRVLNDVIFTGSPDLLTAADAAFYAIINYILYENQSLDWLFKTSFVTVDYQNRSLDVQGNFEPDNALVIQDFVDESSPFHTRIREFRDIYSDQDYGNIGLVDFDLPAQYDSNYADFILTYTANPKQNSQLPLSAFQNQVGMTLDSQSCFITSTGLPSNLNTGTFSPVWNFGFVKYPTSSSIQYDTPNNTEGPIAVAVDGVPFYSSDSGLTQTLYQYGNISSPLANVATTQTFRYNSVYTAQQNSQDPGIGFATAYAPWEYLTNPPALQSAANAHSPIIGYAWDGVPIYGPYGYENPDGSGNIVIQTSSWQLSSTPRLDSAGCPIVAGLQLAEWAAPTGEYIEDFVYVPLSGTLDYNNGRFCTTPDYPGGVYAYFATVDPSDGVTPVYPYIIGPQYNSIPYGLKYTYINGINTPVYPNGNVTLPSLNLYTSQQAIRTPDGTFPTDAITLEQSQYSPWNLNYSCSITDISVSYPGEGYLDINSQIVITPANGRGVNANAYVSSLQVVSASLVSGGNAYNIGDTISLVGGIYSNPAQILVSNVANNAITEFALINVTNQYYQTTPSSPSNVATANVTGNGYGAYFNVSFGIESVTVANIGSGYTATPYIAVLDSNANSAAQLYPVLNNATTRKFNSALRFDRVSPTVEYITANASYPVGSIVYSNVTASFLQALVSNANILSVGNANIWSAANIVSVDTSTAVNRIMASYNPTANMYGNNIALLMAGVEYSGVLVNAPGFTTTYVVPSGSIFDQEDPNVGSTSLNISWQPSLITDTALNPEYARFGESSAAFVEDVNQYVIVNQTSPDLSYLTIGQADFTLEFYVNFSNFGNTGSVMVDMRTADPEGSLLSNGLVVWEQGGNLCVGADTFHAFINAGELAFVPNCWNYVVVQGNAASISSNVASSISCYMNGGLVGSALVNYNFTGANLTLGAAGDGSQQGTGYLDEIRLSTNFNRYAYSAEVIGDNLVYSPPINIPVTDQSFPRNIFADPYFLTHYTPVLWGMNGYINESPGQLTFQAVNAQTFLQDLSWNQKQVLLVNYGANLVINNSTLNPITSAQDSEILAVTLNQG